MPRNISFNQKNYSSRTKPQPVTKRNIDGKEEDFYPTPAWATRALLGYEKFEGDVWECARGDGSMSNILEAHGYYVYSSDKYDRGFGETGIDFLERDLMVDNIITNPPYKLAGHFVLHGLHKSQHKLALLLRLAFLEGIERNQKILKPNP
ncbi:MAG: hypothetical protein ACU4EQ_03925 [Candidatus Nitrosoglobus sp.]